MNNIVKIRIHNCLDCPCHFKKHIGGGDEGCFCGCVEEEDEARIERFGERHKLVAADKEDIRMWSKIPDWCPLL